MRVAVADEGEVTTRAAQSLSTHPDVEVVLLEPATSSQFEVVESPEGCAAVFGADLAADAASRAGLPAIVMGDLQAAGGICWASIPGMALALAAGMENPDLVGAALPGDPGGDRTVVFPSPIDGRQTGLESFGDRQLHVGRGDGPLASALAIGPRLHRVIIDDHRFMGGIALAAGVALLDDDLSAPVPVWERAAPYLQAAADMGLVIGERAPV